MTRPCRAPHEDRLARTVLVLKQPVAHRAAEARRVVRLRRHPAARRLLGHRHELAPVLPAEQRLAAARTARVWGQRRGDRDVVREQRARLRRRGRRLGLGWGLALALACVVRRDALRVCAPGGWGERGRGGGTAGLRHRIGDIRGKVGREGYGR